MREAGDCRGGRTVAPDPWARYSTAGGSDRACVDHWGSICTVYARRDVLASRAVAPIPARSLRSERIGVFYGGEKKRRKIYPGAMSVVAAVITPI
jgi:hypothetical protein